MFAIHILMINSSFTNCDVVHTYDYAKRREYGCVSWPIIYLNDCSTYESWWDKEQFIDHHCFEKDFFLDMSVSESLNRPISIVFISQNIHFDLKISSNYCIISFNEQSFIVKFGTKVKFIYRISMNWKNLLDQKSFWFQTFYIIFHLSTETQLMYTIFWTNRQYC